MLEEKKKAVSAKVLCIGTNVNINSLPHTYPGRANNHSGGKTLQATEGVVPPPPHFLPRVLTNSLKGMTFHLTSRKNSYGEPSSCISAFS